MKRLLLVSFLFASYTSVFAQTNVYRPFPDSNGVWTELHTWTAGSYEYNDHYQYAILGDTLIANHYYHKLYVEHYDENDTVITENNSALIGGLREDSLRRVYFYNINFGGNEAVIDSIYKLYDFSLQIGDTMKYQTMEGYAYSDIILNSIDSVLVNNQYRKRYNFQNFEHWIEGIGSTRSILSPITLMPTCFCIHELICYKFNDNTYYLNPAYSNCYRVSSIYDVKTLKPKDNSIVISPNPFTTSAQITFNQTYQSIALEVYDIQGKLLMQNRYANCNQIELKRGNLEDGLYFLKLTMDGNRVETRKIIINN